MDSTCLKEFRSTCSIWFANTVLVQSFSSNQHQTCSYEQLKMHQNCELTRDYSFSLRSFSFGAFFSPKWMITCENAILVHSKWFEWVLLVQIRTNTLHQNCVCESNWTRGSELLQTLFCTKNGPPSYINSPVITILIFPYCWVAKIITWRRTGKWRSKRQLSQER